MRKVPAGHLHDRLEPGVQRGQASGPAASRTLEPWCRDVDRVDPVPQEGGGGGDRVRAGPARRADLPVTRSCPPRRSRRLMNPQGRLVCEGRGVIASIAGRRYRRYRRPHEPIGPVPPAVVSHELSPQRGVDGRCQQPQVGGPAWAARARRPDPDAAPRRVHLAAAVRADAAQGPWRFFGQPIGHQ